MNLKKLVTQLTLAAFASSALLACSQAKTQRWSSLELPVYGFDIGNQRLYEGQKETPNETVDFSDPRLGQFIAIQVEDFQSLKTYCEVR